MSAQTLKPAQVRVKRINAGNYETIDGSFWICNYMGVWTVGAKDDEDSCHLLDFMTLAEAREFLAEELVRRG